MTENRPIGIFDSGVGGVTLLRALRNLMPAEDYIYFGDTGRVPYGSKTPEIIVDYSVQISKFLRAKNVKAIVAACNTASATAGKVLEDILDVPFIDVIRPTVREAVALTKKGRIGVIGTKNTIYSYAYQKEIIKINQGLTVFGNACPMIVPYIEEDATDSPGLKIELKRYLEPITQQGIDTLILGCTHYPIIKDQIYEVIGELTSDQITLVDSSTSTAQEAYTTLGNLGILRKEGQGKLTFYVTGGVKDFETQIKRFGFPQMHIHQVEIVKLQEPTKVHGAEEYVVEKMAG